MTQMGHQMLAELALRDAQKALEAARESGDPAKIADAEGDVREAELGCAVARADAYERA